MGKYVQRIAYNGKEILFMDSPGLNEEEGIAAWDEMGQELRKERNGCRVLVNAADTGVSLAMLNKIKAVADTIKGIPGNRVAFIGLNALQRSTAQIHARSVGIQAHFCSTVQEGKEWLVKEDDKHR